MKLFSTVLLISLFSVLPGVRDKEAGPSSEKLVPVFIRFTNLAGGQKLVLNSGNYSNGSGEQFSVSAFQYFVSNLKLHRTDGSEYAVEQDSSYFLVNEENPETKTAQINIPAGDYDRLTFVLGVDSLRNIMPIGKRTGVLDPANAMDNGMYWGWNSGYIFFKMEGISRQVAVDPGGQRKFRYHIGGFGGYKVPTINNIKIISLDLAKGGIAKVRKERNTTIYVAADLLKVFDGNTSIRLAEHSAVMFSEFSVNIANNYSHMFSHDHTENQ